MTIRLTAKSIRQAKKEAQHRFSNGGVLKGWFEDLDVPDRQVYEAEIFKVLKSAFRRRTTKKVRQTKPDFFTFEPAYSKGEGE